MKNVIPEQKSGIQTNTESEVELATEQEAKEKAKVKGTESAPSLLPFGFCLLPFAFTRRVFSAWPDGSGRWRGW